MGTLCNVSKSTACRSIWACLRALVVYLPNYVRFPENNEFSRIKDGFFEIAEFPSIIGLIDCTHIRILAPNQYEHVYVNRKSFHSYNVQCVCDHNGTFTNINAKWPGSAHDSRIFRESALHHYLEQNPNVGYLLGDSGYACKPYLLTPFLRPNSPAHERYNRKHRKTRVLIEQVFGRWKRRFSILHMEVRVKYDRVSLIIACCAILHNIAVKYRLPDVGDYYEEENYIDNFQNNEVQDGLMYRLIIANNF